MHLKRLAAYALALPASIVSMDAQALAATSPARTASSQPGAASIEKTTFEYVTKQGQKLYLDRVIDTSIKVAGKRPVLIYSFGGGWETGERNDPLSNVFLQHFASLGYVVISIDYRRFIAEAKAKGEIAPDKSVATMDAYMRAYGELYMRAIDWGVEDLFDATSYVVRHADEWNVDKDRIVIAGSSAGATNSLVAEYNVANDTVLAQTHLPKDFRFAGVVAMAGAFWLRGTGTPLRFKKKPAPMMFFHGPKDQLVTYDETHVGFSGYGPAYFSRAFAGSDYPKWFVDVADADHVMSIAPMIDYRDEIDAFLEKLVRKHEQTSVHTIEIDKLTKSFGNVLQLYGDQLRPPQTGAGQK